MKRVFHYLPEDLVDDLFIEKGDSIEAEEVLRVSITCD